ncbi:MAG: hypothetical protein RJB62_380 [Pseudomonadota bacterium]|jgi:hypothetical protein
MKNTSFFAAALLCGPLSAFAAESPQGKGDFIKADGGSAGAVALSQTPNGGS